MWSKFIQIQHVISQLIFETVKKFFQLSTSLDIWCHPMSDFDWPDVSYFQAKFGWERVKASKVILNYSKLSRFDKLFGGGLAPPYIYILQVSSHCSL